MKNNYATGGYISNKLLEEIIRTAGKRPIVYGDSGAFVMEYDAIWNPKLSKQQKLNPDNIEKVIFNPPATIVIFKDGTKEVVKAHEEDFDAEKGLAMIFMNIIFDGNKSELRRFIQKCLKENDYNE